MTRENTPGDNTSGENVTSENARPDFEDTLETARQAISDFEFSEGLTVKAHLRHSPDMLELRAATDRQGLAYQASKADLEREGTGWFIRKALRSLQDRFAAGHLPLLQADGGAEVEVLRPASAYPL